MPGTTMWVSRAALCLSSVPPPLLSSRDSAAGLGGGIFDSAFRSYLGRVWGIGRRRLRLAGWSRRIVAGSARGAWIAFP